MHIQAHCAYIVDVDDDDDDGTADDEDSSSRMMRIIDDRRRIINALNVEAGGAADDELIAISYGQQ